jgi:transcriptional regulator with XRE-family HTH domain
VVPLTRELDPTAGPLDFFGAEVRRWRTAAGLSQEQLGQKVGYSGAQVGKVETGERTPSPDFVEYCDRALPDAGGLFARIYELARRWDGSYPSWFTEWVEAERRAISLHTWEPLLIPGLLQTPDYARALFKA